MARLRYWSASVLTASVLGGCGCVGSPAVPGPSIVISNLKATALGSLQVCGGDSQQTLTQFTFDFTVSGIDLAGETAVFRISPSGGQPEMLAEIASCSSGPCAAVRRACIMSGRSTASGSIELAGAETYQPQSSWTLEVRRGGPAPVRSNTLTVDVSYPPQ